MTADYVGRFAPSTTGPLHFGSLLAAVASYLDARAHGGHWLLRLDDLDTPRSVPDADRDIINALESHGLHWDGDVTRQSDNIAAYQAAFSTLINSRSLFACTCSRKSLRSLPRYPGTCRAHVLLNAEHPDSAARIRVPAESFSFRDRVFGMQSENLAATTGDFIVRRRDGLFSYQLAVVVDDADAGINQVVRGADLLDNSARQLFLMQKLTITPPQYAHIPVITDRRGAKLSKQTFATAVSSADASTNLFTILALLGQEPPPKLLRAPPQAILDWAQHHWRLDNIRASASLQGFVSI